LITQKIDLDVMTLQDLFGVTDANLHALEQALSVSVVTHEGAAEIRGEDEEAVSQTAQEAVQETVSRAAQIAAARRGASRAGAVQAGIRRMKNIDGLYNICMRKPGCRLTLGLFKDII